MNLPSETETSRSTKKTKLVSKVTSFSLLQFRHLEFLNPLSQLFVELFLEFITPLAANFTFVDKCSPFGSESTTTSNTAPFPGVPPNFQCREVTLGCIFLLIIIIVTIMINNSDIILIIVVIFVIIIYYQLLSIIMILLLLHTVTKIT